MTLPVLTGARIRLRPLDEGDAGALHTAYGDPVVMRHWDVPPSRDALQTATRVGRMLNSNPLFFGPWVVERIGDQAFVGVVIYHHRETWNRRLEIGWMVARAHWRQGYATEAVRLALRHCFETLETHRIEATINPDNKASTALALRLGFKAEGGVMRDRLCVGGVFQDVCMYSLLAPEWRALRDAEGERFSG